MPTKDGKTTIAEALAKMGTPLPFTKERKPRKRVIPPHVDGSETSYAAALAMVNRTDGLKKQVLTLLQSGGPMTDEAIAVTLKLNPSTARPRRIELVQDGLVVQVGEGKTRSGRRAALWGVATSIGGA
jgi:hypothetical protein